MCTVDAEMARQIRGKLPILFPYHSHIFRDSYGSGMGIVWVRDPLLGVPENYTETPIGFDH